MTTRRIPRTRIGAVRIAQTPRAREAAPQSRAIAGIASRPTLCSLMRFVPALAIVVAGLALYLSRGVLDQVVTAGGLVRVAFLPPWPSIGGFVAVGVLGLLWLDRRAVPRASATAVRPPLGPMLLPLFILALLLIPYLPVLPDVVPWLQLPAGPARTIVWLIVGTQLVWVLAQLRLVRVDWLQAASLRQMTIAVAVGTATLSGAAAYRLTGTPLYPAGDEPHYLVIAQSLWRDGDLKIENNHTRGDYREYFPRDLEPHYLTRGVDREIYSIHPIGMPFLIAPVYAVSGYYGVVFVFVLMAAAAAATMWSTLVRATNDVGAATFAWTAVAATSPFLFNTFAVYPEIPAALAVVLAFRAMTSESRRWPTWLLTGAACSVLPWLSTKYAPTSAALVAIAVGRIVIPVSASTLDSRRHLAPALGEPPSSDYTRVLAVVLPYAISLLGWFYFFYATWGSPLPQSPYGDLVQTDIGNLIFGAPGLLFDQEYGLVPYAPVYLLAGSGFWAMWRSRGETRRTAIEIAVVFLALLATVGAFRIWWGGSAAPSRPLTSVLLLLALPIACAFRAAPAGSARRAAQAVLLSASVGIAGLLLFVERGVLTANDRDGTSRLLEYLSPRWPLWSVVPSFTYHEAWTALGHCAMWAAIIGLTAAAITRVRARHAGGVSLAVMTAMTASLAAAMIVMPLLPLQPPFPSIDVRARAHVPLLDAFDTAARPLAIEYTPFRLVQPSAVLPYATLDLIPRLRTEPQPMRVLHNGRFSLPAGSYRLEVDWNGRRAGESLGLQLGRTGNAWQTWPVDPQPGTPWTIEFTLPLDVSFVGLRGSAELERIIDRVRIIPTAVVDATRRPRTPEVLAASQSGPASVFYFDGNAFEEDLGFWVRASRSTRIAIQRADTAGPLVIRVHSGPVANQLTVATPGWQRHVRLQPERREDIDIPAKTAGLVTLELTADGGFVPRESDSNSSDPRPLGVWIEVAK
jgi:hypothetical protein